MENLLEVQNLKKYFVVPSGYLHAVDDVSFSIREGETLGVVGESGCGKSTLGRTILRLHEPTSGRIIYDGMDLCSFHKSEMLQIRKEMQIIFQDPYASLDPRFTVSQIIEEPLILHKVYKTVEARKQRVLELMDLVGLSKQYYNAYPHEFDGGKRQRIVIGRALAVTPRFIVCDEPVSALDVSVQAQILNLIMELQEKLKLTYIFISHDLSVVKHISDNILVMYLGRVIEKAPKNELFRSPHHPYTMALLSAIPSVKIREKRQRIILKGEISSPVNPGKGCRFANRCSYADQKCFEHEPALTQCGTDHYVACHKNIQSIKGGK